MLTTIQRLGAGTWQEDGAVDARNTGITEVFEEHEEEEEQPQQPETTSTIQLVQTDQEADGIPAAISYETVTPEKGAVASDHILQPEGANSVIPSHPESNDEDSRISDLGPLSLSPPVSSLLNPVEEEEEEVIFEHETETDPASENSITGVFDSEVPPPASANDKEEHSNPVDSVSNEDSGDGQAANTPCTASSSASSHETDDRQGSTMRSRSCNQERFTGVQTSSNRVIGKRMPSKSAAVHSFRGAPMTMPMRLAELIKVLWSPDPTVAKASLMELHSLIDQCVEKEQRAFHADLPDICLELAFLRRGGHLAVVHALQTHLADDAIQAMGWGALAWLCEHCNVKSTLVGKGVVPLVCTVLKTAEPLVATEALYFLGHLSTLPKVAEQVTVHDATVLANVVRRLHVCPTEQFEIAESAVDGLFFLLQRLAAHKSLSMLTGLWNAGCLAFVVRHLQDSVSEYQAGHSEEQLRLEVGCRILTSWAKTNCATTTCFNRTRIVQTMIEAGALTLAAELVRLFPPGTPLRRVANPCLRSMVPVIEDEK